MYSIAVTVSSTDLLQKRLAKICQTENFKNNQIAFKVSSCLAG
jgi:hypothetical protein